MQIVIEISEKVYGLLKYFESALKDVGNSNNATVKEVLIGAVLNGTPLPKGHGRLIDGDKIYAIVSKYSDNEGAVDGNKGDDENYLIHKDSILEIIETRETVIPADKEDAE